MKKNIVSKKEIEHIAWLAHVTLSEEEKTLFTEQFNEILGYFQKINEANTEDVPPTYHILELINVQRKDTVTPSLPADEALKNAPKKEERFYKAPRII